MSYIVKLTKKAKKSMNKLDKATKDRINKALINLIDYYDGKNVSEPDVKILKGKYFGLLRLRVGNYRIIFKLEENELIILILEIVARGSAYKK
ncbi:type II toxin-antitoxin system RelE/ParE family toxin [Marinitoga aeolica]|uniref:Type II toxin-antitoxin system RelE/ParE family toxin n=2 Tax=Marinitoga aeolica TaxID=2809031 RepID=A0ABY8PU66_9BACT|nr:type II toxin-antitoxin system RelE/ParE family toxin [Marinitoga aeolica]